MLHEAFTFDKLLNAYKKCRLSKQHKKEVVNFEINLAEGETINLVNYYIADRCIYIDGYIYLIDLSKQEITPILYENSLN